MQIKNLTITHKKDLRIILNDFSMVLNAGDKAAIIGEEGNGKSTLLKLIHNPELIEGYAEYEGEIIKNGAITGYLPQELPAEEADKTVYEYLLGEEAFSDMAPKELASMAAGLAVDPGIFYSDQKMGMLSGGEKVKLQIARILMGKPDILLLDEPTNDVDIPMLEWLEDFILNTQLPFLFISHDETLLANTANKIIHIEQIRRKTASRCTVAVCGYEEYIEKRSRSLEHQLQNARSERSEYEKQQARFRQIYSRVEHEQKVISRGDPAGARLLKKKMHVLKAQEKRFEKNADNMTEFPETEDAIFIKFGQKACIPNGKTVLDLKLDKLEAGGRVLAENIELRVEGPRHLCITGRNGVGKTTLLKIIAEMLLGRTDIKACYMPQNYEDEMDFSMTPVEFLARTGDKDETARNRTYLGSMKYTADEMLHQISELSGGQRAKLFLLKMSIEGGDVLILDEPTRNFSPLSGPVIRNMLAGFGGAIISVSHDRKYIEEVCDTIYKM